MSRSDAALMWFRRDLRVADNAALYAALKDARRVHCVFVYDTEILDALPSRSDRRTSSAASATPSNPCSILPASIGRSRSVSSRASLLAK